jgi:hypothetical protein
MRHARLFALFTALLLVPTAARAQADHLTCFRAKDAGKFAATATMDAIQNSFDPTGECQIKGKAALFCVPSEKTLGTFTVDGAPGTALPVPGTTPIPDIVCYKAKCPVGAIPDHDVVDQFGSRTFSKFKASMICAPAFKVAPECLAPDPPQCTNNDPCTDGICSTTRVTCGQQSDCPLQPNEQCCCNGICV